MEEIRPEGIELITFLNNKFYKPVNGLKVTKSVYPQKKRNIEGVVIPKNASDIYEIHNPTLFASFILRKKEYQIRSVNTSTKMLLHATPTANLENILDRNFDHRSIKRFKFGIGVAFTPRAGYAIYCLKNKNSDQSMIIAEVLMGQCELRHTEWLKTISIDTGVSPNGAVYVKARDDEFYPKYSLKFEVINKQKTIAAVLPDSSLNAHTVPKEPSYNNTFKENYNSSSAQRAQSIFQHTSQSQNIATPQYSQPIQHTQYPRSTPLVQPIQQPQYPRSPPIFQSFEDFYQYSRSTQPVQHTQVQPTYRTSYIPSTPNPTRYSSEKSSSNCCIL